MSRHQRCHLRTEVEVLTDIDFLHASAPTRDQGTFVVLGGGGAFVSVDTRYPIGCMLLFRFRLPGDSAEIRCQGIVCNEVEGQGVGVEFLGISPVDRYRIMLFVVQHMTEI